MNLDDKTEIQPKKIDVNNAIKEIGLKFSIKGEIVIYHSKTHTFNQRKEDRRPI